MSAAASGSTPAAHYPRISATDVAVGGDLVTTISHVVNHHHGPDRPPAANADRVVVGRIPRRAPHFVERAQLRQLRSAMERYAAPVVITGMRGAGKTQVAAAYAREAVARGWGLVGWINAETHDRLYADLAEIALRVGVAVPEQDSVGSASRLRDHLSARGEPALLVFDNASDPDLLDTVLPTGTATRVVVTTTDQAFTQFGEIVDTSTGFDRAESVRYLDEATGLADTDGAAQVAEDLGDLPLALSAAAATVVGRHLGYARYRELLRDEPLPAALPRRRGSDHPLTVDQALSLSVRTAETSTGDTELDETVRWLLGVMAMLAPTGVDYALLSARSGRMDAAVQRCVEGSLVSWAPTGPLVIMHRLPARVLRERARADGRFAELVGAAATVIIPWIFDEPAEFQRPEQDTPLVEHTEALWSAVSAPPAVGAEILSLVLATRQWAALQLMSTDAARAARLAHAVLTDHQRISGPDHPATWSFRNTLAHANAAVGRVGDAISLFEQVAAHSVDTVGSDHPDTLTCRNNLGSAYQSAGRTIEAIALHEQNLADRLRVLGDDHPHTLISGNNLAHAYVTMGRAADAVPLLERNLAVGTRVLGLEHPDTLSLRNNLGDAYVEAGRAADAVELYERNLADRVRILGADHPDTQTSRNNLAVMYQSAGRVDEAIELLARILAVRIRVEGADNPRTLSSSHNLAAAYRIGGRVAEAISLSERTLDDCERVLGSGHPQTLNARSGLALGYAAAGRVTEAIRLNERTVADRLGLLGADHPDTLTSRNNLASAYLAAGRVSEAIDLHTPTLASRERVLGTDHPDTLGSRSNLAFAHQAAGRVTEAIEMHERSLADRERVLGPEHPDTLQSRNNLAYSYRQAGRVHDALALFTRNLAYGERVRGSDHPHTITSRLHLAVSYDLLGRLDQAIPLYERTLADRARVLGTGDPRTVQVRDDLESARRRFAEGADDSAG